MEIAVQGLGKKFQKEWIFRNLDCSFRNNHPSAIVGPNGSGKTTLLMLVSGFSLPSAGSVSYMHKAKEIDVADVFKHISMAAPYLEMVEEMTLLESLRFHFSFKSMVPGMTVTEFMERTSLEKARNKYIKHFSSGMKTRLKLGLCFFGDSPIILLDEPTSNLDTKGVDWYHNSIMQAQKDRLVIICSNQEHEYEFCQQTIDLAKFK